MFRFHIITSEFLYLCIEFFFHRYNYWLEEGRKLAMKKYNMLSICLAFTFFFMYGAYGIGFSYGSYLVELGITSPGSIFTVSLQICTYSYSLLSLSFVE